MTSKFLTMLTAAVTAVTFSPTLSAQGAEAENGQAVTNFLNCAYTESGAFSKYPSLPRGSRWPSVGTPWEYLEGSSLKMPECYVLRGPSLDRYNEILLSDKN